jgi:hypothetical protein
MLIQVTSVGEVVTKQGKKVPYKQFELNYLSNGRAGKKQIMSFTDVFKTLLAAAEGEEFEITTQQDGEYTNWATATTLGVPHTTNKEGLPTTIVASAKGATAFKSTYETPEERAKKQVYIVRQSSIAQAVAFIEQTEGGEPSVQDVLHIAKQFEDYVFGATQPQLDDSIVEVD